jgi:hypothetical protein
VFQIYYSGEQESLPGAGETDDAMNWSGRLTDDDEYVIVVGGTRGNASYTLMIFNQVGRSRASIAERVCFCGEFNWKYLSTITI